MQSSFVPQTPTNQSSAYLTKVNLLLSLFLQGKVLNEELKHNVAEKLREPLTVDKISKDLEKVNDEELEILKAKIEELQNAKRDTE